MNKEKIDDNISMSEPEPISAKVVLIQVPFLTFQEETPMICSKRRESIFIPDVEELNVEESDLDESPDNSQINTVNESLKMLNEFLACRDASPVRHKLSVRWDSAHERTKRRYSRKAKQSVREVLKDIALGQSNKLLSTLGGNVPSERTQAEVELLQALAES